MALADRIARLEQGVAKTADRRRWHRIVWHPRQPWVDAWRDVREDCRPGDNIIIRRIVDARNGQPVPDPIHERDRALAMGAGR